MNLTEPDARRPLAKVLEQVVMYRHTQLASISSCTAFFLAFAFQTFSLAASMAGAAIIYPSRQKGTYWIRCLLRNAPVVQIYMASVHPRQRMPRSEAAPPPPPRGRFIAHARARLALLLDLLRDEFQSLQAAFRFHSRNMHIRLARALL